MLTSRREITHRSFRLRCWRDSSTTSPPACGSLLIPPPAMQERYIQTPLPPSERIIPNSPPALREGIKGRARRAPLLLPVKSALFAPSLILPHSAKRTAGEWLEFLSQSGGRGLSRPLSQCHCTWIEIVEK